MNEINLLFFDFGISKTKIEELICSKFNLAIFDFSTEFQSQILNEKSELTTEIKEYLANGEIIPLFAIEKFLLEKFSQLQTEKTLLLGFPKTKEQYELLVKIVSDLKIQLKNIWYFEQNSPEKFKSEFFLKKDEDLLQENQKDLFKKFGEEAKDNWDKVYLQGKKSIQNIKEISKNIKWTIIKVEIENVKDENYIIDKINNKA